MNRTFLWRLRATSFLKCWYPVPASNWWMKPRHRIPSMQPNGKGFWMCKHRWREWHLLESPLALRLNNNNNKNRYSNHCCRNSNPLCYAGNLESDNTIGRQSFMNWFSQGTGFYSILLVLNQFKTLSD